MLDIAASYHYIQFQGQLTNQTQENGKKTNFGPHLGSFDQNLPPPPKKKTFFWRGAYLYQMIDIVASYHCMQFQRKVMTRTPENGKKTSFWA